MGLNSPFNRFKVGDRENSPLSDLTILDISRLVAGNMTSLQLADFGANVIKVEPLPNGDPLRAWKKKGYSTFWKDYGRNKKSLALDFRKNGAIDILKELIKKADVLIESFRPGTLEKMGFSVEELHKLQPKLIILRVSGFGQNGPYSPRPGFGTLVEGMSGFAHRNGEVGGDPLLPPLALADMISGLYGSSAIMMAIYARDKHEFGQVIDLSLLDAMVSVLGPEAIDYQITGKPKPRVGNGSNTSSPRNAYKTSDGHYIAISASIQKTAERLFCTIGKAEMINDARFKTNDDRVTNRLLVDEIVGGWIKERSKKEVLTIFEKDGITAAPLFNIVDIQKDAHFIERGIYQEIPDEELGTIPIHSPVPRLSNTPSNIRFVSPKLGQNTQEILEFAGFSDDKINSFINNSVVLKVK